MALEDPVRTLGGAAVAVLKGLQDLFGLRLSSREYPGHLFGLLILVQITRKIDTPRLRKFAIPPQEVRTKALF